MERIGVEAQIAEMIGELGRPMRAKYFSRLDSPDGFDELIVIRMVRQRQRMVNTKAILRGFVLRPTRDGDRNRFAEPRQAELAGRSWQCDDCVTVEWLTVV